MSSRKTKRSKDKEWIKKQTKTRSKAEDLLCIIHSQKLSQYGNFTSFDDGKDTHRTKLETLHKIRGRRLQEDASSSNRMQDVCELIPQTVDGLDTEKTGWHRKCYQQFTKNLDRLKPAVMSLLHHLCHHWNLVHHRQCLLVYLVNVWPRLSRRNQLFFSHVTNACSVTRRQSRNVETRNFQLKPSLNGVINLLAGRT